MTEHLLTAANGGDTLKMPRGNYCAFMLGPSSIHDIVDLQLPGVGTVRLRAGAVVPADVSAQEQVKVEVVRYFSGDRLVHVMAVGAAALAVPSRRAPYVRRNEQFDATASNQDALVVPFAGRRHVRFAITNTDVGTAVTWTIVGRTWYGTGATDYDETTLEAATVLGASATVGHHEGGTDSEESLDEVVLQLQSAAGTVSTRIHADAFGELGD